MKRAIRHIAFTVFLSTIATASFSVYADNIVIDSGTDETVVSRLPDAGQEDEFVCFDTATSTGRRNTLIKSFSRRSKV